MWGLATFQALSREVWYEVDTNLTICWASHNCFDVVGYKKAAIVQKPFLELIPEEDHPHVLGMIRQAEQLDQPGNARAVYRRLTAQGKLLLVEAEARAIVQKPAEASSGSGNAGTSAPATSDWLPTGQFPMHGVQAPQRLASQQALSDMISYAMQSHMQSALPATFVPAYHQAPVMATQMYPPFVADPVHGYIYPSIPGSMPSVETLQHQLMTMSMGLSQGTPAALSRPAMPWPSPQPVDPGHAESRSLMRIAVIEKEVVTTGASLIDLHVPSLISDQAMEMVIEYTSEGIVNRASHGCLGLLNCSREALQGLSVLATVAPADKEHVMHVLAASKQKLATSADYTSVVVSMEFRRVKSGADQTVIWVHARGNAILGDKGAVSFVMVESYYDDAIRNRVFQAVLDACTDRLDAQTPDVAEPVLPVSMRTESDSRPATRPGTPGASNLGDALSPGLMSIGTSSARVSMDEASQNFRSWAKEAMTRALVEPVPFVTLHADRPAPILAWRADVVPLVRRVVQARRSVLGGRRVASHDGSHMGSGPASVTSRTSLEALRQGSAVIPSPRRGSGASFGSPGDNRGDPSPPRLSRVPSGSFHGSVDHAPAGPVQRQAPLSDRPPRP